MVRLATKWRAVAAGLLLSMGVLMVPASAAYGSSSTALTCNPPVSVTVTVAPDNPTPYNVVGQLCAQGPWQSKPVVVTQSGGSYDHHEWDFPYQPDRYSFVRWAASQGFAVFNMDRLGTGVSDKPPAALVTTTSSAWVLHQVVQGLKNGTAVKGYTAPKVVVYGHSFGSFVAAVEAKNYADVNGLVLTGFLHQFNQAGFTEISATLVPAPNGPPGYITTAPGARGPDFYNEQYADHNAIAIDEQLKTVDSGAENNDLAVAFDPATTQGIHVPVVLVVGQNDKFFCNTAAGLPCDTSAEVLARESQLYAPDACLQAVVQPNSGHTIALHPNATVGYSALTKLGC